MTICIAAVCRWQYGTTEKPDLGSTIITASDRMLTDTAVGIEYEPAGQGKWAYLIQRGVSADETAKSTCMIMVSDSMDIHSDLIKRIVRYINRTKPLPDTETIAKTYGDYLAQLKASRAVRYSIGSNYGFDATKFASLQRRMDPNIVAQIDQQMQAYENRTNAEAIIIGCDEDTTCHIYHVDKYGIIHCHDDIGFLCIGAGRLQANAQFVQHEYSNLWPMYPTLMLVYNAKKSAELSGGVGKKATDVHQITRDGGFALHTDRFKALEETYKKFDNLRRALEQDAVNELIKEDGKVIRALGWGVSASPVSPAQPGPSSPQQAPSGVPPAGKPAQTPPPKRPRRSRRRG